MKFKTHREDAEDQSKMFKIKNLCVLSASVVNPCFFPVLIPSLPRSDWYWMSLLKDKSLGDPD